MQPAAACVQPAVCSLLLLLLFATWRCFVCSLVLLPATCVVAAACSLALFCACGLLLLLQSVAVDCSLMLVQLCGGWRCLPAACCCLVAAVAAAARLLALLLCVALTRCSLLLLFTQL